METYVEIPQRLKMELVHAEAKHNISRLGVAFSTAEAAELMDGQKDSKPIRLRMDRNLVNNLEKFRRLNEPIKKKKKRRSRKSKKRFRPKMRKLWKKFSSQPRPMY